MLGCPCVQIAKLSGGVAAISDPNLSFAGSTHINQTWCLASELVIKTVLLYSALSHTFRLWLVEDMLHLYQLLVPLS